MLDRQTTLVCPAEVVIIFVALNARRPTVCQFDADRGVGGAGRAGIADETRGTRVRSRIAVRRRSPAVNVVCAGHAFHRARRQLANRGRILAASAVRETGDANVRCGVTNTVWAAVRVKARHAGVPVDAIDLAYLSGRASSSGLQARHAHVVSWGARIHVAEASSRVARAVAVLQTWHTGS